MVRILVNQNVTNVDQIAHRRVSTLADLAGLRHLRPAQRHQVLISFRASWDQAGQNAGAPGHISSISAAFLQHFCMLNHVDSADAVVKRCY